MITESYGFGNIGLFSLDTVTGKVTVFGGAYNGYEVYAPSPFNNQVTRPLRFTNGPVQYPLKCSTPGGVYSSGAVLKCEVSAPWEDGVIRRYSAFNSLISSPVGAWTIIKDDYIRGGTYDYELGMFYGDQACGYQK